jgi:hypothetical protein
MTLNKLIYNIRNLIRDAKSDDIKISDRQIEFIINYIRAKLIRQDKGKGRSLSNNVIQDLGIVELELIDSSESTTTKSNKYILRSKLPIPKPIEVEQKDLIEYVGGIDKLSPVQIVSKAYASKIKDSKYIGDCTIAFLRNDRLYVITNNKFLKNINIEGVFDNPRDVYNFYKTPTQRSYNPDIDEYPISAYMIQTLNKIILTEELSIFLQLSDDNRNDASDEVTPDEAKRQQTR